MVAALAIGGILCNHEQAEQLHHFWDGSMATARMLSVTMKVPLWQIRSWAQSCGLPPARDELRTRWTVETMPPDTTPDPPQRWREEEYMPMVTEEVLPELTEDQQSILIKVWRGAGDKTRQAAVVLAKEFAIQAWQVKAWATRLGIAEPNLDEFNTMVAEVMGDVPTPKPSRRLKAPEPETEKATMDIEQTKKCAACGARKPTSAFRRSPRTDDGLTKCCIACIDKQKQRDLAGIAAAARELEDGVEGAKAVEIIHPNIPALPAPEQIKAQETKAVGNRYEMLYTLLRDLPESGRWSEHEYERWWGAFAGVFGYLVRVVVDADAVEEAS